MSFLFGRRPRTNTVDLPKQAKEQLLKLDGPAGATKVSNHDRPAEVGEQALTDY